MVNETRIEENCATCGRAELRKIVADRHIPFACPGCGGLLFKHRPLHDRVFVWVEPLPEKVGGIHIPDEYYHGGNPRWKLLAHAWGTVLAAAQGYWHPEKRKYIHRHDLLKPGDHVMFDKLLLIKSPIELPDHEGRQQTVFMMGYADIYGFVHE